MAAANQPTAVRAVELQFATLRVTSWGCETIFKDGAIVSAWPHSDVRYHIISHRCGYGDYVHRYAVEHELAHSFIAERLLGRPSCVLWALAHQREPHQGKAILEEALVQMFQRWLRASEEPIVGGCDWYGLKEAALPLFDSLWISQP